MRGNWLYEAAVPAGLEDIAAADLRDLVGSRAARLDAGHLTGAVGAGRVEFTYTGDVRRLLDLRAALAVYLVGSFHVARPRALLGDAQLRDVASAVREVIRLWPANTFSHLRIGAAGADSPALQRLAVELTRHAGLQHRASYPPEGGELYVRLRRAEASRGWDVLVRLSPRPLSTRAWRVCDMPGALNAAVAHAMVRLTRPRASDTVLNLACGSGTLAIERLACGPAHRVLACDTSAAALRCATANLAAAGLSRAAELHPWDARCTPLPAGSVDVVLADLPFGHRVGSHAANAALYSPLLAEAARVTRAGGTCVLISHSSQLMLHAIRATPAWTVSETRKVSLARVEARIWTLRK